MINNPREKRTNRVLIIVIILAASLIHICLSDISSLDELWNYNFSRMVSMGLIPYRDFNMVPTPLFTLIMSLPLFICRSLLIYRITCALLIAFVSCVYYQTLVTGTDNKLTPLPFVLMGVLIVDYVSYNNLFFILILIIQMLIEKGKCKKYSVLVGFLSALSIFARQTSGCILLVSTLAIILIFYEDKLKNVMKFIIGAVIPCFAFLIFFTATSSLHDFWDYCLFGLLRFGDNNKQFFTNSIILLIVLGIELIVDIGMVIRHKSNAAIIHLILGVTVLTISIPIVDYSHVQFAVLFFLIPLYRKVSMSYSDKIGKRTMVYLSSVIFIATAIFGLGKVFDKTIIKDSNELKYIPVDQSVLYDYSYLSNLINDWKSDGYNVTFFSSSSVITSIMNGDAHPPYDTFNNGNFPGSVTDHIVYVENACAGDNSIVIIADNYYEDGTQNPAGVLEYVQSNCEFIDSYGRFSIYRGS